MASHIPVTNSHAAEKLSDLYKLGNNDVHQVLEDAESIGFVDVECVSSGEKLLFNGNLIRRDEANKIKAVLDSLSASSIHGLLKSPTSLLLTPAFPYNKSNKY